MAWGCLHRAGFHQWRRPSLGETSVGDSMWNEFPIEQITAISCDCIAGLGLNPHEYFPMGRGDTTKRAALLNSEAEYQGFVGLGKNHGRSGWYLARIWALRRTLQIIDFEPLLQNHENRYRLSKYYRRYLEKGADELLWQWEHGKAFRGTQNAQVSKI